MVMVFSTSNFESNYPYLLIMVMVFYTSNINGVNTEAP